MTMPNAAPIGAPAENAAKAVERAWPEKLVAMMPIALGVLPDQPDPRCLMEL